MRISETSPLRIAIIDDHTLIRDALKTRLSMEPGFRVDGVCATSQELIETLRVTPLDLVIVDYQLTDGEMDGLRLIDWLRRQYPELLVVVFSALGRPATVNMSIRAGAKGFVSKSQEVGALFEAVRTVVAGRIYLPPLIAAEFDKLPAPGNVEIAELGTGELMLAAYAELSPKESEVLRCCLEGLSVSQIAAKFSRSRKTISGQKQAAFRKLGIQTDTELFKLNNLLDG